MSELTTAHHDWDQRWATDAGREAWLRPEASVERVFRQYLVGDQPMVVDLGCGVGRHALFYAEAGARVLACDGAAQGLAFGRASAEEAGLGPRIRWHRGPFDQIPGDDQSVDLVLAWNVIYHGTMDDIASALAEIHRVLHKDGLAQLTMLSKRNARYGIGSEVAPNTWVDESDAEKAHAHCYTDERDLLNLFGDAFAIFELCDREHKYPGSGSWHWEIVIQKR
ncbi:MAG: class I SAM-dependent methyltransferase [Planctomycetota bacterium]|nr:MAG: class I SAM-dependent methyltransferase [Planctomycetota bacterium]